MRERPKSREETPKEGDGNGRKSLATALQQHTLRRTKFKAGRSGWDVFPHIICENPAHSASNVEKLL